MTATTSPSSALRAPGTGVLAAGGLVLSAIVIFLGNYNVRPGENGGTSDGIFTGVLCAIVAALLFGVVVPRVRGRQGAAVALGVVTVLSLAVFWAGITPILAAAALAVAGPVSSPGARTTIVRWVVVAATVLVVVWTVVNAHLW
jgi:hypothetical protein